jgi:hypothetical protein
VVTALGNMGKAEATVLPVLIELLHHPEATARR